MSAPDYCMCVGDRLPVIREALFDQNGVPADIAGATVRMKVGRADGSAEDRYETTVTIIPDPEDTVVQYDPVAADTAFPGMLFLRWEVTYLDGRVSCFPDDPEPITLLVSPR